MLHIKVLGPGCPNCETLELVVKTAVTALGVEATVEKVSDYASILQYSIISTPGLVVNEQVVAAGRIPTEAEVMSWLTNALEAA